MGRQMSRAGGGAVFVGDRDGGLDVYVDAARAGQALEVIDVEDGEYPSAYRVDGAVLDLLDDDGLVVLDFSGEVDEAGLRALIDGHAHQRATPPAGSPLDVAQVWLSQEWESARSRRPRWLHRRLNPSRPPSREELAAPPGIAAPRLVRPWLLREVVEEALAFLPQGAVHVVEETAGADTMLHLRPGAAGAVDVLVRQRRLSWVDVFVAGSAPIEITAPYNVNYAPPHRFWQDDVREVLSVVARGQALVALNPTGAADAVELPGGRLGAFIHGTPHQPTTRPPAWG